MVDFNNETTVAQPPHLINHITYLERLEQIIEALESYYLIESNNMETYTKETVIKARIMALWFKMGAMVKRRLGEERFTELDHAVKGMKKPEDLIDFFQWMNSFIDDIGLNKVDVKAKLSGNIMERNRAQGWR